MDINKLIWLEPAKELNDFRAILFEIDLGSGAAQILNIVECAGERKAIKLCLDHAGVDADEVRVKCGEDAPDAIPCGNHFMLPAKRRGLTWLVRQAVGERERVARLKAEEEAKPMEQRMREFEEGVFRRAVNRSKDALTREQMLAIIEDEWK
jgi:hypothetical protein